jgi:hypothetical protein
MKLTCFVICPIGDENSDIRKHSDQVLRHILTPALEGRYEIIRADSMPKPGVITSQIMDAIFNSDLVIADLTGRNPNVFYELALRHASRKPYIQLMKSGDSLPFDIAGVRTIRFELSDPDNIELVKVTLKRQVDEIEKGHKPDSPVSMALSESLFQSNENALALFLEKFWEMEDGFERLHQSIDSVDSNITSVEIDVSSIDTNVSSINSEIDKISDLEYKIDQLILMLHEQDNKSS